MALRSLSKTTKPTHIAAMSSDLAQRLVADAVEAETLRDRYCYRGNATYPRQFPGEAYSRLDRKAADLRAAAEIIRDHTA